MSFFICDMTYRIIHFIFICPNRSFINSKILIVFFSVESRSEWVGHWATLSLLRLILALGLGGTLSSAWEIICKIYLGLAAFKESDLFPVLFLRFPTSSSSFLLLFLEFRVESKGEYICAHKWNLVFWRAHLDVLGLFPAKCVMLEILRPSIMMQRTKQNKNPHFTHLCGKRY